MNRISLTGQLRCLRSASSQLRSFSACPIHCSKLARKPVNVPADVSLTLIHPKPPARPPPNPWQEPEQRTLRVDGPLGSLSMKIPTFLTVSRNKPPHGPVTLSILDPTIAQHRALWGTYRAHLVNHIAGVSLGHTALLRFIGVGYRASVETTATTVKAEWPGQTFVSLKVGYSHPIELPVPRGVKASSPNPTRLLLEGVEREVVMSFAADIRRWRRPEPYKGKGIFVNDETIQLKAKKIK